MNFLRKHIKSDDVIINAVGMAKTTDNDITDLITINSLFPQILAKFKKEIPCRIIHISTDGVFSGKTGSYIESDNHDPIDDYGKSKSLGENNKITNIRTSIIGEEKNNKKSLLEWVISNKGGSVDGYENHTWNGVTCLELVKVIHKIIKDNLYWEGVRHICSPNVISKYELVSIINEIYDLKISINRKLTKENCYRNLKTLFEPMIDKEIYDQITEMKNFDIKSRL